MLSMAAAAQAQPPAPGNQASVTYSWSGKADVRRSGGAEIGVQRAATQADWQLPIDTMSSWRAGFSAEQTWIDTSGNVAVPERLHAYALRLGYSRTLSPQWSLAISAAPGIYADAAEFGDGTLNAPVLLTAIYAASRELAWVVGARYDGFSDRQVVPFAGARWQFAPEWTLDLAFPRTGVTYKVGEGITAGGYVSVQGGNYRVTSDVRPAGRTGPTLGRTYLDYYEIRVGGGVDWPLGPTSSLRVEAGLVTNRTFDYFERNFRVKTGDAPFGSLAWRVQF